MRHLVKGFTIISLVLAASGVHAEGPVRHQIDDPAAAVDYWTHERMQRAEPMPLFDRLTGPMDGSRARLTTVEPTRERSKDVPERILDGEPRKTAPEGKAGYGHQPEIDVCGYDPGCTVFLPDELRDHSPHVAIGKLFFTLYGFDFQCSAASVTSRGSGGLGNRQTVLTAGHCCNDGAGTFDESAVFVPAYDRGEAPHGVWPAQALYTTPQWDQGLGLAYSRDVCVIRTAPGTGEFEGEDLHDVVGALGIKFNTRHPLGREYSLNGYPIEGWGGEEPVITLGSASVRDLAYEPPPFGVPSLLTGGASGGPWLVRYRAIENPVGNGQRGRNVIGGINAYVYNGEEMVFSPYFDSEIYTLWRFAATQP